MSSILIEVQSKNIDIMPRHGSPVAIFGRFITILVAHCHFVLQFAVGGSDDVAVSCELCVRPGWPVETHSIERRLRSTQPNFNFY